MTTAKLEIDPLNAIKAYKRADESGKRLLTDLFGEDTLKLDVKARVGSYLDACQEIGMKPLTINDFSFLPPRDRESAFAYHQLTIIAVALNEGWEPDWSNNSQYKYYPWFEYKKGLAGGGSGFSFDVYVYDVSTSTVGSRLVFKSRELAEYAAKQFEDIYNKFLL